MYLYQEGRDGELFFAVVECIRIDSRRPQVCVLIFHFFIKFRHAKTGTLQLGAQQGAPKGSSDVFPFFHPSFFRPKLNSPAAEERKIIGPGSCEMKEFDLSSVYQQNDLRLSLPPP